MERIQKIYVIAKKSEIQTKIGNMPIKSKGYKHLQCDYRKK